MRDDMQKAALYTLEQAKEININLYKQKQSRKITWQSKESVQANGASLGRS
jgi:hypothetical protein